MSAAPTIANVLYPRKDARDDEVERLDGILLQPGNAIIGRCLYYLSPMGPPEYTVAGQQCIAVTYRWLMHPVTRG